MKIKMLGIYILYCIARMQLFFAAERRRFGRKRGRRGVSATGPTSQDAKPRV
jgi:hypothetical protein